MLQPAADANSNKKHLIQQQYFEGEQHQTETNKLYELVKQNFKPMILFDDITDQMHTVSELTRIKPVTLLQTLYTTERQ